MARICLVSAISALLISSAFSLSGEPPAGSPNAGVAADGTSSSSSSGAASSSSSGDIFVKPSIIDSARDAVDNRNLPNEAHNGAWLAANSGGVAHDMADQPIVGSSGVQMGQTNGGSANAGSNSGVVSAPAPAPASQPVAVSQQQTVAIPVMTEQQTVGVPVMDSGREAQVSTNIGGHRASENFQVGKGPLVAILPAGSNLTATWDLNSNARPTVGFAAVTDATVQAIPVAIVQATESTSTSTSTMSSTTIMNRLANAVGVADSNNLLVPVILPVGVSSLSNSDLARNPSLKPENAIPVGSAGSNTVGAVGANQEPVIMTNRRLEIRLIDFRLSQPNLNQNVQIWARFSVDALRPQDAVALNASSQMEHPVLSQTVVKRPESTSGYVNVYNGSYQSAQNDNKITVQKDLSQDLCGQVPDAGLLEVQIKPSSANDEGTFPSQYYACTVNLAFQSATNAAESNWSEIRECRSTSQYISNFEALLWYEVRQYNINWNSCQQNRPTALV